jgi:hypothetical protein
MSQEKSAQKINLNVNPDEVRNLLQQQYQVANLIGRIEQQLASGEGLKLTQDELNAMLTMVGSSNTYIAAANFVQSISMQAQEQLSKATEAKPTAEKKTK